jgi:prefoldin subunit 5
MRGPLQTDKSITDLQNDVEALQKAIAKLQARIRKLEKGAGAE